MANEADTCRKFVVPKLQAAGWGRATERSKNINLPILGALPFPLVPLPEQRKAVEILDAFYSKIDSVKTLQTEFAELDAMLPAVLDKTFTGEL